MGQPEPRPVQTYEVTSLYWAIRGGINALDLQQCRIVAPDVNAEHGSELSIILRMSLAVHADRGQAAYTMITAS
jgi:hypothetical protein